MYEIVLGDVFTSQWNNGESMPLSWHAKFADPSILDGCQKYVNLKTPGVNKTEALDGTLLWKEIAEGIYAFSLYVEKDWLHGNQPYYWSSNPAAFGCLTGKDVVAVGFYAVRKDLVHVPDGYTWDENQHFLERKE